MFSSKRTPNIQLEHTQVIPNPQLKGIPKHKLLDRAFLGTFHGYVGKFLGFLRETDPLDLSTRIGSNFIQGWQFSTSILRQNIVDNSICKLWPWGSYPYHSLGLGVYRWLRTYSFFGANNFFQPPKMFGGKSKYINYLTQLFSDLWQPHLLHPKRIQLELYLSPFGLLAVHNQNLT